MDFELPGEDHPKRKAVRAWFEANLQPTGRALAEAGYIVPHWPKPWGLAAEPELQLIVDEEMKRAGVVLPHNPVAVNNCAQSLLTHGTEAQRRRFLAAGARRRGNCGACCSASRRAVPILARCAPSPGAMAITNGVKGHKIWTSLATRRKSACWSRAPSPTCPSIRACRNS